MNATRRSPVARAMLLVLPLVAVATSVASCKATEGERCVCASDCKGGLVCLAAGRVLGQDECSPATGEGAEPGECLDPGAAGIGDDGFDDPEIFMDLGSKRDFDPAPPPEPVGTDTGSGSGSGSSGSDGGTSTTGTGTGTGTSTDSSTGPTTSSGSGGTSSSTGG